MASVQEWQALNREMASLARAGVPLELGLSQLARALPQRLGQLSGRVAARLQEGRSLTESLHLEGRNVSESYVAVVEAALEANRLPEALDAVVAHGSAVQDLRRRIALALLYPSLVLILAYVLFWLFVLRIAPTVIATLEISPERAEVPLWILQNVWDFAHRWQWLGMAGFVLLMLLLLRNLLSATTGFAAGGLVFGTNWFPGAGRVYADLDRSHVTGLMQLLLSHGVPLPRALRFAGAAAQSAALRHALLDLAEGTERGEPLVDLAAKQTQLPWLIRQMFAAGEREGCLADALGQAATIYHRRAVRRAEWLRTILTPVLVTVIGGTVTLLYGLALFLPVRELLLGL